MRRFAAAAAAAAAAGKRGALHPALAQATPAVPADRAPPTAAAWLRARGSLPAASIAALFRRRAVRVVLDGDRVARVAAGARLPPGASLAVPASALEGARPEPGKQPPSRATLGLAKALPGLTLVTTPDLWIVAKPAGVHSQPGGAASAATLDAAAVAGLGPDARLVHRLDAGVSGCVAVANGAGAAAWLAEALAAPAAAAAAEPGAAAPPTSASITKVYLALVDTTRALILRPGAAGVADGPLPLTPTAGGAAKKHLAAARAAAGSAPPPPAPPVRGARGGGGGRRGQGANQSNPPLSLSTSAPSRAGASWPTAPPTPCSP